MVRPPKGTGEQIGSNLVMNAIEAMSKVGDRARELVRNALDPSGRAIQASPEWFRSCPEPACRSDFRLALR
jgi:hypothetical protein